ncbi:MAG: dienelactone hydrolase family protein [Candidatus Harrisonbacteria bacterium]|nr:dienelactone hydrolase family protein [Candidatus Harrisonbacteria bacterium]
MAETNKIKIPLTSITLEGIFKIPPKAKGAVIFVHGSGSSQLSPRNTYVAEILQKAGFATLLFDLLTEKEDQLYENRFNITLLTERLIEVTKWLKKQPKTNNLTTGYFGASTGAAAALEAAARLGTDIKAIVSRGGRPDLVKIKKLKTIQTPTLLIVGGKDDVVLRLNEQTLQLLDAEKKLEIVPDATHLFEEPGTLEKVAELASNWFKKYLL